MIHYADTLRWTSEDQEGRLNSEGFAYMNTVRRFARELLGFGNLTTASTRSYAC
ncbi:hypothetical protein PAXRUDRAFT_825077 [Paxillus rubicundulus Ve08.2h10]|uniref:Uncharacterized protein n=1 Tax=Paxillus rubicundulus Ve08.2h10 TaxID=930991 RepID=A0A0D0EBB2_9AGAM|nr:hypothetical protein PAXRUDRAFT_825077 [Paxillus rubicundulus Ve08.2h10]